MKRERRIFYRKSLTNVERKKIWEREKKESNK